MSRDFYTKIEKQLTKLLGGVIGCSCKEISVWDEENWYLDKFESNRICTECYIRDGLVEVCHRSIVGRVQPKTVAKLLIKTQRMQAMGSEEEEIDNMRLLAFIAKLEEYKTQAADEKTKQKLKKKYKKYLRQRKAKRRRTAKKRFNNTLNRMSYGGTD